MSLSTFKLCRLTHFHNCLTPELDKEKKLVYEKVPSNQQNVYLKQILAQSTSLLCLDNSGKGQDRLNKSLKFFKLIYLLRRKLNLKKEEGTGFFYQQFRPNQEDHQNCINLIKSGKQLSMKPLEQILKDNPYAEINQKHTILLSNWSFSNSVSYNEFSEKLCSLFNQVEKNKSIFIGVDPQTKRIIGLSLTNSQITRIVSLIKEIRKNCIFPTPLEEELQLNFIKVTNQDFGYPHALSLKKDQKYVIKISVHQIDSRSHFIQNKVFTENTYSKNVYIMWANNQQVLDEQIYLKIHRIFYKRNKLPSNQIKYKDSSQVQDGKILHYPLFKEIKLNKADLNIYGSVPEKDFNYHSILIVSKSKKAIDMLENLKSWAQKKGILIVKQIYQKIPRNSNRNLFYLNHSIPTGELITKVEELDNDRKNMLLMKIKPQLELLRPEFFSKAYSIVKQRFQNYFKEQLKVIYKYGNGNKLMHYFVFENQIEAIFCFVLLECSDIRANFISESKIKNGWFL